MANFINGILKVINQYGRIPVNNFNSIMTPTSSNFLCSFLPLKDLKAVRVVLTLLLLYLLMMIRNNIMKPVLNLPSAGKVIYWITGVS